jgi:hypothetical protein
MSTYVPVATQTLNSAASEVIFSSIPQNYTDLVIIGSTKNTANNGDEVCIRFNADTGSNYARTRIYGNGSTAAASNSSNTSKGALGINSTSNFTPFIAHVQNYTNEGVYKTVLSRGTSPDYASSYVSSWRSTSPIKTITLLPDSGTTFVSGSKFTIYGIAAGNSSAKASGGNIVTTDGSYWYHAFTSSGAFIPNEALTADYFVVAGGAGGGYSQGGGGGAGGVLSSTSVSLAQSGVYLAVIGAGGVGSTSLQSYGMDGSNSIFSSSTAIGGGGGGTGGVTGRNGGSGGGTGGNGPGGTYGAKTTGQGNNGGTAYTAGNYYGGGGGGGAGADGGNGSSGAGGNGGNGLNTWSTWLSSTGLGASGYIAGGGGGGTFTGGSYGTGGAGGGGRAGNYSSGEAGQSAAANTGSGGGGSSYGPSFPGSAGSGGNGASGLIIVRYAV